MLGDIESSVLEKVNEQMRLACQALDIDARHAAKLFLGRWDGIEHRQLEATVALLLGVELRGVARQPLHAEILRMRGEKVAHARLPMRRKMIPHDDERPAGCRK